MLIVYGQPVPKKRPRVTRHGTYTPKETVQYENAVRRAWQASGREMLPPDTPLSATVVAHFTIPKSASKKAHAAMLGAPHIKSRGDLDNIVKSILDALNGVAYPDDCAVCHIEARKVYGEEPFTEYDVKIYNKEEGADGGEKPV